MQKVDTSKYITERVPLVEESYVTLNNQTNATPIPPSSTSPTKSLGSKVLDFLKKPVVLIVSGLAIIGTTFYLFSKPKKKTYKKRR